MTEKTRVPWLSIVVAGLLAFAVSVAITGAIVAGYALMLAVKAKGAPNPDKIATFANGVAPILGPSMLSILVVFAARKVVRRAQSRHLWHGVLTGVVAAVPTLIFTGTPNLREAVGLLLPVAAGLLGAYLAMRRT